MTTWTVEILSIPADKGLNHLLDKDQALFTKSEAAQDYLDWLIETYDVTGIVIPFVKENM